MKQLVFATNNAHKLSEIKQLAGNGFQILSLAEIKCFDEIPETADTLKGNAQQKADYVYQRFGMPCFADDTGLEIEALNGEPGVYSARYAGEKCSFNDNMLKVLDKLKHTDKRKAVFRTVICYVNNNIHYFFEGTVHGVILHEPDGSQGFGYDPIFQPTGYDKSFARFTTEQKNAISHRGIATRKFIDFLKKA